MTLKEYRQYFNTQLSDKYPQSEIDTFFFILVEEYLEMQRVDVVMKPDLDINKDQLNFLDTALQRLIKEEPLQYITGKTEFYGLPFLVNQNVLIPRPETEELVEWIISSLPPQACHTEPVEVKSRSEKSLKILDIGTGSGCIPISLKKNLPNADISAIDISGEALKVAKKNAQLNEVAINFIQHDILKVNNLELVIGNSQTEPVEVKTKQSPSHDEIKFDIIVSNPPYVRELEKQEIKNNVLENEPHLALFVEDGNPLLFYNKIANLAKEHLTPKGMLFFEINQYLGTETVDLLKEKGFQNIELKKDLFGNDRMILAHK